MNEILILILAGAVGGLVRDVINDGYMELPYLKEGKFYIGFLASILVGGFIGWISGDPISAGLGGYVGKSILDKLVKNGEPK